MAIVTTRYEIDLCNALVAICDDIPAIKDLTKDAGINWADVSQVGTARSVWGSVVEQARNQGRVGVLIQLTAQLYPRDDDLQRLAAEFNPADYPPIVQQERGFEGSQRTPVWPAKSYRYVDRVEHLDEVQSAIARSSARPMVVLVCGDNLARHDLLKSRIDFRDLDKPMSIGGRTLAPVVKPCNLTGNMHADLRRACFQFLQSPATESLDGLTPLLVGKGFEGHLLRVVVDLAWDRESCRQIEAILDWCSRIGPVAEDRRLIIAVSIEVSPVKPGLFSFLTRSPRTPLVHEAHQQLRALIAHRETAILLPVLNNIEVHHLRAWRTQMESRFGPRDDDLFGDPGLGQIVNSREAKPMHNVVVELERLLKSN